MMNPKIVDLPPKLLVGLSADTTINEFVAPSLWQQFMPKRSTLPHLVDHRNYSIQLYNGVFNFSEFTPETPYTYWAAAEVSKRDDSLDGTPFSYIEIPGGLYAVFLHTGTMEMLYQTLQYIYIEWLPNSGYIVEKRPHFELLDERYLGHTNPKSQEEIWVPITPK